MMHYDAWHQQDDSDCYHDYAETSKPLLGKIIVLDPGHGGRYTGGVHYGFRESDINLSVGLKLRRRLTRLGAKVVMTRTLDVSLTPADATLTADLEARVAVAKKADADIFVSLHVDDVPNINLSGVASYFPEERSSALAFSIQTALVDETCANDHGVSPANFYVLVHNEMPAALIEVGYLSNPTEALCLMNNSYRNRIATGIAKGILNYFLCGE